MSGKQLLFGPRTVHVLGVMLLLGLALRGGAWWFEWDAGMVIGFWLTVPFLMLLALLLVVVLPWTWFTSRRR